MDVVQLLIQHGADVHAESEDALRSASQHGLADVVQLLLQHGADVHACSTGALQRATANGHNEVVQLLMKSGACMPTPVKAGVKFI